MKNKLLVFFAIYFSSCTKPSKQNIISTNDILQIKHSTSKQTDTILKKKDSLQKNTEHECPIKIITTKLTQNEYSTHKDIQITFKNTGKKDIKAIKFEWFCINSFEEPASGKNFYGEGRFTENSIHLLKPNHTKTEFWEDFSTDADKVTTIRAYYIVFTDGTKWESNGDFKNK